MNTMEKRRFAVWRDLIPAFTVPPRPADALATAMEEVHRWRFWHGTGWITASAGLLPVGLLSLFLWSGSLLRLADPTAGVLDAGIISVLLLALLAGSSIALLASLLLRLVRETLTGGFRWDEQTDGLTKRIRPCLEAKLCTATYWGLLLLLGWVFMGLL